MNKDLSNSDGAVVGVAKVFWRTRQFWACAALVVATCVFTGYVIGNWVAATGAKVILAQQAKAYNEASEARRVVLQQCLTTNAENSKRLAELGNKVADVASKDAKE